MALGHSPKIVTDGLVFYYDMGNTQKSWKGKPTTNLKSNPDMSQGVSSYGSYVSSSPVTKTVYDFPSSVGQAKTVLECYSASANGGGGNPGGMVFANPTLTAGLSYTISFWARCINKSSLSTTYSNQNGSGDDSNLAFSRTITPKWQYYTNSVSSLSAMKTWWYIWANDVNAIWQYADFQIEQNSFATPFVNGTRSNTQAVLDITGNNTITATSLTYASDGTFSFNGTSDYITIPNTLLGNGNIDWTVSAWVKTSTTVNALGLGSVMSNANSGPVYCMMGVNAGKIVYWTYQNNAWSQKLGIGKTVNDNVWHMLTWVNYNNYKMDMYVDGLLDSNVPNSTSGNNNPVDRIGGSWNGFFSGSISSVSRYTRALSAAEVLQNFNALRGRFGV
jgi:hypothetical protein